MNISSIDLTNNPVPSKQNSAQSSDALRQAAMQFESLLLLQLTSALNGTNEDGEDNLFGSDGGTSLAKQMFSEQLATSMAQSGGVGLADLIASKLGEKQPKAIAAIKEIRESGVKIKALSHKEGKILGAVKPSINLSNTSDSRPVSVDSNSPDGIEIVSTAAEDIAKYGDADLPKPVMGDEKLFKYYRPRIVPDYALNSANSVRNVESVETATPIVNKTSLAATNVVAYQMPVRGKVSSEFGDRFHPIDKRHKFHGGIDIAAPQGTPIATAASGKVAFAGWRNGYGNMVVIEHADGRETRYGHASRLFVSTGETVTAGQQIAAVGSTGKSTGPHLHFEMRENHQAVDPLKFMP